MEKAFSATVWSKSQS